MGPRCALCGQHIPLQGFGLPPIHRATAHSTFSDCVRSFHVAPCAERCRTTFCSTLGSAWASFSAVANIGRLPEMDGPKMPVSRRKKSAISPVARKAASNSVGSGGAAGSTAAAATTRSRLHPALPRRPPHCRDGGRAPPPPQTPVLKIYNFYLKIKNILPMLRSFSPLSARCPGSLPPAFSIVCSVWP